MKRDSPPSVAPTDPRFYDEAYYSTQLHNRHWFRNNRGKFRLRWHSTLRLLQLQPSDVLLELGCASGEHTLRLAPLVAQAIGVDFSADAVRLARAAAREQAIDAQFLQADVADLRVIEDASVDKVLALDLVEHIEDDVLRRMLAESWRVLRPGGRLVLYTPSASHYVERMKAANFLLRQLPGHIAVRDGTAYQALLAGQAWASVAVDYLPSSYPVFGWLDRWLMHLPAVQPLFRFRILALAIKP